jgi:acyl-CoA synthetase (NDP forming)
MTIPAPQKDITEWAQVDVRDYFSPLITPRTIAVVGASASGDNRANGFIRQQREFGFTGEIYAIHPTATEIEGCKAYPTLGDTPTPIDYALVAIPAARVPDTLRKANNRVRFAHVLASGFAEVEEGKSLQVDLVSAAREGGVRFFGPNCNGGYSPRGGLTFTAGASRETGGVGVISQSGGLAVDIIRTGQERGLRFSGVMTVGNCADLGPSELLAFYLADPDTKVIGLYIEGLSDGRRFFETLRRAKAAKPVIILKGALSGPGQQAAVSHTGALAGDARVWRALSRQTGAVLAHNLEEFIDIAMTFQKLTPKAQKKPELSGPVALFGNGGGVGVLAVDAFADRGLTVSPFNKDTQQHLASVGLPPGTSVANPIDVPAGTLAAKDGKVVEAMMDMIFKAEPLSAFVLHLNLTVIWSHLVGTNDTLVENLITAAKRLRDETKDVCPILIVLRSDGRADIDARKRLCRTLALESGFPVFDDLANAATGLAALRFHESFRARAEK